MTARRASSSSGDGASSMTFWCRRCRLHSRSPRWMTVPWQSARTWTSMCRGESMYFSTSRVSSPNAARASRRADASASGSSARRAGHPHALAAAARGWLDQEREPRFVKRGDELLIGQPRSPGPRDNRDASGRDGGLGGDLVAHRLDRLRRRPDERQARGRAGAGEPGVLGQEPVAGVDGLRAGCLRGGDDRLDGQVALRGRRRADPHRLVGRADVRGAGVGVAVDRDAGDAHAAVACG